MGWTSVEVGGRAGDGLLGAHGKGKGGRREGKGKGKDGGKRAAPAVLSQRYLVERGREAGGVGEAGERGDEGGGVGPSASASASASRRKEKKEKKRKVSQRERLMSADRTDEDVADHGYGVGRARGKRGARTRDEGGGDDGGAPGHGAGGVALDGEVVDGRLYMVDKRRGLVYDGEGGGGLARVGRWVEGRVVEDPPQEEVGEAEAGGATGEVAPARRAARVEHPFDVDDADHCETGVESYADLVPVLDLVCAQLGRTRETLRIYDPYYCDGAVVRNLGRYGFRSVHNVCEDFYAVVRDGRVPEYDCIVTNPPYSGEHVSRLLAWCASGTGAGAGGGKPAFLLLPNHFYTKPYFPRMSLDACWFLCPTKRYCYWAPLGMRAKGHAHRNAGRGERTSPFVSLWFLLFGASGDGVALRESVGAAWAAGGTLARDMKVARKAVMEDAARVKGTPDAFPVDAAALDAQYTVLARGVRDLPLGCRADEDPLKLKGGAGSGRWAPKGKKRRGERAPSQRHPRPRVTL